MLTEDDPARWPGTHQNLVVVRRKGDCGSSDSRNVRKDSPSEVQRSSVDAQLQTHVHLRRSAAMRSLVAASWWA